ncbi:conserved exported protein of unknown function [Methylocaldum szegediense]|uniref:GumN family protein n=2 Tax=Methylocaldum szegediense TaxID=73780 RepID=A0ABM9I3B0_9GAMM|nr:TraB/GumN family protein [Methylocaldum szegediense]CAI8861245.1 conserved exported protein of unknown function [Methylocaldum szegediense]
MFHFTKLASLFVSVLAVMPTSVSADVYKCLDKKNKVFYQDRPCQDLTSAQLPPGLSRSVQSSDAAHFLWKANSAQGTVYVMGALPYGEKDMYPLPDVITEALSESDVLVVGVNIAALPEAELLSVAANQGVYVDNSDLSKHVTAPTWERVLKVSKMLGLSEETLRTQKPWLASLSLMHQAAKQAGYTPEFSGDKMVIKDAEMRKPIIQLDAVEEQAKLMDGLSEIEQEQMLVQTLNEIERGDGYFKSLAEAWAKGDTSAVESIMRRRSDSLPASAKLAKVLRFDRIAAIAEKIAELAADGRTYFVVLEAGYLVGEHGFLDQLQVKGFKLSQL